MDGATVVIVTGASEGVGTVAATQLARDGYIVVAHHHNRQEQAQRVVADIEAFGGMAQAYDADITDAIDVRRMFNAVEAQLGGVDVLVNAAECRRSGRLSDVDDATFDAQLEANLRGTFHNLREAARCMRRGGRIINISSTAVTEYEERHAAYAATKAGIDVMTRALSRELAEREIVVNAVSVAPAATSVSQDPLVLSWTDVAALIAFLAGPYCGCVNGQVIRADVALRRVRRRRSE